MIVFIAAKNMRQSITEQTDFAQTNVGRRTGEKPGLTTKKGTVRIAEVSSMPTNMQRHKPVLGNAQVKSVGIKSIQLDGYADVYNMEVKDNHNYVVNGGIIVHNCMDATRYFVNTMRITRQKRGD